MRGLFEGKKIYINKPPEHLRDDKFYRDYKELKDVIQDERGKITYTPYYANFILVHCDHFTTNSQGDVVYKYYTLTEDWSRYDDQPTTNSRYNYTKPWCLPKLVERFATHSSDTRSTDRHTEAMQVVLKPQWIWRCVERGKVLDGRYGWDGMRIVGQYDPHGRIGGSGHHPQYSAQQSRRSTSMMQMRYDRVPLSQPRYGPSDTGLHTAHAYTHKEEDGNARAMIPNSTRMDVPNKQAEDTSSQPGPERALMPSEQPQEEVQTTDFTITSGTTAQVIPNGEDDYANMSNGVRSASQDPASANQAESSQAGKAILIDSSGRPLYLYLHEKAEGCEGFVQAMGGILAPIQFAHYIVLHRSNEMPLASCRQAERDIMRERQQFQQVVCTNWLVACYRQQRLVNHGEFTICNASAESSTEPSLSLSNGIGGKRKSDGDGQEVGTKRPKQDEHGNGAAQDGEA